MKPKRIFTLGEAIDLMNEHQKAWSLPKAIMLF